MLVKLEKYILEHLSDWGLKAQSLTPLIRFNKEANGLVKSDQIGTVIFWFSEDSKDPLLITKSPVASKKPLFLNSLPYYPKVYDFTELAFFMEPIRGHTFEMELNLALFGPEGNPEAVSSCLSRHLSDMSQAYQEFSKIDLETQAFSCGEWAAKKGGEQGLIPQRALMHIQRVLSSLPYTNHHVLIDHNPANIFPGPYFVDQFDSVETYRERKDNEPGLLDPIRFLIAYFRTSPLNKLYHDWISALGCALHDEKHELLLSCPLQDFFRKIGWDGETFWALLMMGLSFRIQDELKFHKNNVYFSQLKKELELLFDQLINARSLFLKGDQTILNRIKKNEKSFVFPSNKKMYDPSGNPKLLQKDYKNYNLVGMGQSLYAVKRSLGAVDLPTLSPDHLERLTRGKKILVSHSQSALIKMIDRDFVNTAWYLLKRVIRKLDKYCLFRYTRPNDRTL